MSRSGGDEPSCRIDDGATGGFLEHGMPVYTETDGQAVGSWSPVSVSSVHSVFNHPSVRIGHCVCFDVSLHLAVVGRLQEDGVDLLDEHAILVALLVDLLPLGVLLELLPGFLGGLAAGEGDQVDELARPCRPSRRAASRTRSARRRASSRAGRYGRGTACAGRRACPRWCSTSAARRPGARPPACHRCRVRWPFLAMGVTGFAFSSARAGTIRPRAAGPSRGGESSCRFSLWVLKVGSRIDHLGYIPASGPHKARAASGARQRNRRPPLPFSCRPADRIAAAAARFA